MKKLFIHFYSIVRRFVCFFVACPYYSPRVRLLVDRRQETQLALLLHHPFLHKPSPPTTPMSPTPSVLALSKALVTYTGHAGPVVEVVWSPDGKSLASCGNDGTVQVWSARDGHMLWKASVAHYVFAVAWSPDGQKVAAAGVNGALAIFTATNGQLKVKYQHISCQQ